MVVGEQPRLRGWMHLDPKDACTSHSVDPHSAADPCVMRAIDTRCPVLGFPAKISRCGWWVRLTRFQPCLYCKPQRRLSRSAIKLLAAYNRSFGLANGAQNCQRCSGHMNVTAAA
jgi:hypothetical protein